jgi:hypothetical protein
LDPDGTGLKLLPPDGGPPAPEYAALPYETRFKLHQQSRAVRQKEVGRDLEDYTSYLRAGNQPAALKYSLADLQKVYGPELGAETYQMVEKAAAYGSDVAAVRWATIAEQEALLAEREALLASPEDFRANLQDVVGLRAAIKERNDELRTDAAEFIVKYDPRVDAALRVAVDSKADPAARVEAAREYADAVTSRQSALGIPPAAQRILPKAEVARIADAFAYQPEGGQNAAVTMRRLQKQWGKAWPKVFGQLTEEAKLPGTALVVGAMDRPDQWRPAEKLAEIALVGTKALEDGLPEQKVGDVKKALAKELAEFEGTLANNHGGSSVLRAFQEGTYQLALRYMREGDTASRAANRAYDDVLGKQYEVRDTFRVPREYDADVIADGAWRAMDSLPADLALPSSGAGLSEIQTRDAYMSAVRNAGFWVTAPDESGLVLYDETRTAVMRRNGQPVMLTWEELTRPAPAMADPVSPASRNPAPVFMPDIQETQ